MSDLHKIIINLLNKLKALLSKGNQSMTMIEKIPDTKSKLNSNLIQELLVKEYSNTFLVKIKEELEASYLMKRAQEKLKIAHTAEHQEIVQAMHNIQEDLKKIKQELAATGEVKDDLKRTLRKQLGLINI